MHQHGGTQSERHTDTKSRQNTTPDLSAENMGITTPSLPGHAIVYLQRHIGNSGVRRLLNKQSVSIPQRLSPSATPVVQRDDDADSEPQEEQPASSITIDGETISTYEQALMFFAKRELELIGLKDDFTEGIGYPGSIDTAIEESRGWRAIWNGNEGNMYDEELADISAWYEDYYLPAYNDAQIAQAAEAAKQMDAAKEKAAEAETAANNIEGPSRQLQRALYRAEDTDKLVELAKGIAGYLDMALASKSSIEQITEALDSLKPYKVDVNLTQKLPPVKSKIPKLLNALEALNKVASAAQIAEAAYKVFGASTEANKALASIEAAATIASAGGTILGLSATFGLYTNIYLGPMVSACVSNLKVVNEYYSGTLNRYALEVEENPDRVLWSLEEGGRPMYDFMVPVMQASDWSGVPSPVPQAILDYFEKNEDRLNAGVGAKESENILFHGNTSMGNEGEAMPMEGTIDYTPDTQRIKYWVFNNRRNIWGMLYGDLPVPAG